MEAEQLKEIVEQLKLPQKTFESFYLAFDFYKKEYPDEYFKKFYGGDDNKICLYVNSVSLTLRNWPECDYNHFVVRLDVTYEDKMIGEYCALFTLYGEIDDDSFMTY